MSSSDTIGQNMDVHMTVEEGIQSIVTSGIAISDDSTLSRDELLEMGVEEADLPEERPADD